MQPPSPPRQQRRRGRASRLPLFLLLLLGCLAPSSLAFLLHPQQPQPPSTPTPARARRAPIAAATGAQAAADSAAAVEGAAGVEKGLVVLTREEGKNDKLRGRLEALQVSVMELPCIAHTLAEGHPQLQATLETGGFDYVVITSPEAAHVFLDVAQACRAYAPTNLVPIGEATGTLLTKAGGQIAFAPSKALAKVLAVELPPVERKEGPTRVLYPASKKAQKTLEDGLAARVGADGRPQFEVVRLNTYDTVPAEWGEAETARARACEVVTFASPSALKVWTARLGKQFKVACIGETTATAAREQGWEEARIFYPKENPGIDGWAAAVQAALGAGGEGGQEE